MLIKWFLMDLILGYLDLDFLDLDPKVTKWNPMDWILVPDFDLREILIEPVLAF